MSTIRTSTNRSSTYSGDRHMTSFVESVMAFSEPWDSLAEGPEPDLASVEYDDDAFRECMAEFGPFSDGDEDE